MLAIGFSYEHDGFCGSRLVADYDPQSVADYLFKEFGIWFDQILLVKNDDPSPTVQKHFSINRDYNEN